MNLGIDTFANPEFLWLLIGLIPLIVWYVLKHNHYDPELKTSGLQAFVGYKHSWRIRFRHILFVFRILAVGLMLIALARPQKRDSWHQSDSEGIDIMMALDISGSMLAEDFKPNRLEAAKDIAMDFIADRPQDRIGLVIFAGESFTQCPLTTTHQELMRLFSAVNTDMLPDGTAIGNGLATSVNRLKDSKAASKVVILLSDGVNNSGSVSPLTAAEIAKKFDIRVYTIGVGSEGTAPYPVKTAFGTQYQNMEVKIDEEVLTEIAEMTGGQYFRATNEQKLKKIYEEIDKLEKTIIKEKKYTNTEERFFWFAFVAALLLIAEAILRYTLFKQLP
ncbi:MAG: vWA domain-containing protein [Bacteroidales bacterium]